MLHVVRKQFNAEGRKLAIGSIVDTSNWRNTRVLLEHGFLGEPSASQLARADKEPNRPAGTVQAAKSAQVATDKPAVLARPARLQGGSKPVPVVGKVPPAAK